jgi:hypothetical protein
MRGTLKGVQVRVDRLAGRVGGGAGCSGCPVCQEDEARVQYFHRFAGDPPFDRDAELAPPQTCRACGRTYERRGVVYWHEQPPGGTGRHVV